MTTASQKQDAQREFVNTTTDTIGSEGKAGLVLRGQVKKKVTERGFGFIHAENDGRDYFFHFTDLRVGLDFNEVEEGMCVEFQVKREPSVDKAGAACEVRKSGSLLS